MIAVRAANPCRMYRLVFRLEKRARDQIATFAKLVQVEVIAQEAMSHGFLLIDERAVALARLHPGVGIHRQAVVEDVPRIRAELGVTVPGAVNEDERPFWRAVAYQSSNDASVSGWDHRRGV